MSRRQRMEEAARWFLLRREGASFDEVQRQAFARWLRCSKRNVAAYIAIEKMHANIVRRELARGTPQAVNTKVVSLLDRIRPPSRTVTPAVEPAPAQPLMSRRGVIGAVAAGLSGMCITGTLVSVTATRRQDVIASGHVRLVPLSGGVMHAARHSSFWIDRGDLAQTVNLSMGQAALHLWEGVRTVTRVVTPLGEIVAAPARFGVLVLESMLVVTVAQGRVRVRSSASSPSETVVTAGHELTIRAGGQLQLIAPASVEHKLGWTQGDLYLDGESILEAASMFNRFNELQIRPSPAIAHLSVSTYQCALSNPRRFVERFIADWNLASREVGNTIEIFERDARPETR